MSPSRGSRSGGCARSAKNQVLIADEIGYVPVDKDDSLRFFSLVCDICETTSLVFTTNKNVSEWAEFLGDPVMTSAMLDRILEHAKCFSLGGQSYRMKHHLKEET